jgi:hypothetical protein
MPPYTTTYDIFDAHSHVTGPKGPYTGLMDRLGLSGLVNISFSDFLPWDKLARYEERLLQETDQFPSRYHFCTSFSIIEYQEPDYAKRVIAKLAHDFDERGAIAVKVWKDLGMMLRDSDGAYVFCDHPAFTPIFDYIVSRGKPILMHMADPIAAWQPLDPESPHYQYYTKHPEFHWYGKPGRPSHAEILSRRDTVIARYPDHPFIGAHLGSVEHDVEVLSAYLDAHPNVCVDSSARFGDFIRQPEEKVRALFAKHPDRILFGIDWDVDERTFNNDPDEREQQYGHHCESFGEHFRYFEKTLALPPHTLRAFYNDNARRVYRIPD